MWFNRPWQMGPGANWGQFYAQLGGGQIVGSTSFGSAYSQGTYTANQWNQLVRQQAQQTLTLTANQWNQLVAAQANFRQPHH